MPEDILTSIHGRRFGLSPSGRGIFNINSGLQIASDGVIGNAIAASSPVTNTTAETMFNNFITLPANSLISGSLLRIRYQGIATSTNSTDTLTIKLWLATSTTAGALAGTTLISHAATDVANNDVFSGEYELAIRTEGTSGTMVGCGTFKAVPAAEGTATYRDDILASTSIDTTAVRYIGVSAAWSVASASNSCRLDFLRAILS